MLHEQIRNYKKELYESHASNTVHEKHIGRLQSEIKRLHEAFQVFNAMCLCNSLAVYHTGLNVCKFCCTCIVCASLLANIACAALKMGDTWG